MKQGTKDLGFMALIAGSGAVGFLATMFAVVATRGPAAAPEPPAATEQVDVSRQAVKEVSERVPMIRIRGSASLGMRAQPIVYIDGVRVNGDGDAVRKLVSPDQIDRIEVIKGDAAKELYGSEARNGVIQIVTKSREGS
ncbi:MAG: TonB-dependent receptor plug domain-containing protein [Gemmatimonadota bacterium]|nr:TonB-dependent receptor plug domain-containing protein [Gemmatimonadota bacterium]